LTVPSESRTLSSLLAGIRACRICVGQLEPRPVIHMSAAAKLLIASQAPGLRVHQTGLSFNDASGDRLRDWMGVDRATFYDASKVALAAMAFCFPKATTCRRRRSAPRRGGRGFWRHGPLSRPRCSSAPMRKPGIWGRGENRL